MLSEKGKLKTKFEENVFAFFFIRLAIKSEKKYASMNFDWVITLILFDLDYQPIEKIRIFSSPKQMEQT